MYTYSVMPLDIEHIDEICADIKFQVDNNVAICPLFMIYCSPEGTPAFNKAEEQCINLKLFKEKLDKLGVPTGVLVQSTLGHGRILNYDFPFQHYVNLTDGNSPYVACPSDSGFLDYIKNQMSIIASCHPKVIMIDDDFRLLNRPGKGCACPKHLAEFNKLANTNFTREELFAALKSEDENSKKYIEIFTKVQYETLLNCAKAIRAGIDEQDESIQGVICASSDLLGEIPKVLAGKNNPSIMRVNNGAYTVNARYASFRSQRAAFTSNFEGNYADIYIAEADTCPQNRYSTPASSLHCQVILSICEGIKGAKHWITRLSSYEPESGIAYRNILAKNANRYSELIKYVEQVEWLGARIPIPKKFTFNFNTPYYVNYNWGKEVLERMGIPMYFLRKNENATFIDSDADKYFDDSEILEMLSGTFVMSGDTAERLCARGFSKYLGVKVNGLNTIYPAKEEFDNGKIVQCQKETRNLEIIDNSVRVLTKFYYKLDGEYVYLSPASVVYENSLGGKVLVFAGTMPKHLSFMESFSFLNETRKKQIIDFLKETSNLPLYYDGDTEVFVKTGKLKDGSLMCIFTNIGLDQLEEIPLVINKDFTKIERLTSDGKREKVDFIKDNNKVILKLKSITLMPQILFIN